VGDPTHKEITVLPTIVNIEECRQVAHSYPAVITAGPDAREIAIGHPNHFIKTFGDTTDLRYGPTLRDVEALLDFAALNDGEILVHCHAGMSRSTATALGIAILRGYDWLDAYDLLRRDHPEDRPFIPNSLILRHLETIFGITSMREQIDQWSDEGFYSMSAW
jgi:predicted protein tyrosine phosphatase